MRDKIRKKYVCPFIVEGLYAENTIPPSLSQRNWLNVDPFITILKSYRIKLEEKVTIKKSIVLDNKYIRRYIKQS